MESISPIFYWQLLHAKIPKGQKDTDDLTAFFCFWDLCSQKMHIKCCRNRHMVQRKVKLLEKDFNSCDKISELRRNCLLRHMGGNRWHKFCVQKM
jgi:hypothetical protein